MGLATNQFLVTMLALLVHLIDDLVGAIFGRREVVFTEKMDVGFGTRPLIFVVMNKLDLVERTIRHSCRGSMNLRFHVGTFYERIEE